MHKSDLDPKYHYLASSTLPFTDHLYGEDCDVNKKVREINASIVLEETLEKAIPEVVSGDIILFGEEEPVGDGSHVHLHLLQVRLSLNLLLTQK